MSANGLPHSEVFIRDVVLMTSLLDYSKNSRIMDWADAGKKVMGGVCIESAKNKIGPEAFGMIINGSH